MTQHYMVATLKSWIEDMKQMQNPPAFATKEWKDVELEAICVLAEAFRERDWNNMERYGFCSADPSEDLESFTPTHSSTSTKPNELFAKEWDYAEWESSCRARDVLDGILKLNEHPATELEAEINKRIGWSIKEIHFLEESEAES